MFKKSFSEYNFSLLFGYLLWLISWLVVTTCLPLLMFAFTVLQLIFGYQPTIPPEWMILGPVVYLFAGIAVVPCFIVFRELLYRVLTRQVHLHDVERKIVDYSDRDREYYRIYLGAFSVWCDQSLMYLPSRTVLENVSFRVPRNSHAVRVLIFMGLMRTGDTMGIWI